MRFVAPMSGQAGRREGVLMTEIDEYGRRIAYALDRIGRGVELLQARPAVEPAVEPVADPVVVETVVAEDPRIAELSGALEAERQTNALLSERVRAIREKQETTLSAMEKRLVLATQAMEAAQAETARLRRANHDLSAANAALVEAGGDHAPHLVNAALQAEVEALRAARALEASELDELLSAIDPLVSSHVKEVGGDA